MEVEDMEVRVEEEAEDIMILTPTEVEEVVEVSLTDQMMEDT